jgi:hypothetical protein
MGRNSHAIGYLLGCVPNEPFTIRQLTSDLRDCGATVDVGQILDSINCCTTHVRVGVCKRFRHVPYHNIITLVRDTAYHTNCHLADLRVGVPQALEHALYYALVSWQWNTLQHLHNYRANLSVFVLHLRQNSLDYYVVLGLAHDLDHGLDRSLSDDRLGVF